jgi:protein SCO1/2
MARLIAGLLSAALFALAACTPADAPPPPQFNGVDITGANYARTLELPDATGKPRSLADFHGKATLVFFGFAQCPDVCPTTMAELAEAKRALGADGARVQGVFVTVDPERDTPELLRDYVKQFDPSFVALRGTPEQTQAAAKEFKVYFAKSAARAGSAGYSIDHTAGAFLFDPRGRVRLFLRYGGGAKALAEDLRVLLAEPAA